MPRGRPCRSKNSPPTDQERSRWLPRGIMYWYRLYGIMYRATTAITGTLQPVVPGSLTCRPGVLTLIWHMPRSIRLLLSVMYLRHDRFHRSGTWPSASNCGLPAFTVVLTFLYPIEASGSGRLVVQMASINFRRLYLCTRWWFRSAAVPSCWATYRSAQGLQVLPYCRVQPCTRHTGTVILVVGLFASTRSQLAVAPWATSLDVGRILLRTPTWQPLPVRSQPWS